MIAHHRWLTIETPRQMRTNFLTNEVMEGQRRMWEIKGRIKAAYKYNKHEFHRVSCRREEEQCVQGYNKQYAGS